jgi:hypothetical protein
VFGPDFDMVGLGTRWRALGKNDICGSKDLKRPDSVEQRHTRISQNANVARFGIAGGHVPDGLMFHDGATMPDPKVSGQSR